jgi:hypothetical protein
VLWASKCRTSNGELVVRQLLLKWLTDVVLNDHGDAPVHGRQRGASAPAVARGRQAEHRPRQIFVVVRIRLQDDKAGRVG